MEGNTLEGDHCGPQLPAHQSPGGLFKKKKIATVPSCLQELLSQSLQGSTWKSEFLANVQNDLYD